MDKDTATWTKIKTMKKDKNYLRKSGMRKVYTYRINT